MDQAAMNNLVRNFSNLPTIPPLAARTDVSVAAADDSFNSVAFDYEAIGIKAGMFIEVSGFTEGANNGIFYVVSCTAGKIVVSAALVDELAGDSIVIGLDQNNINKAVIRENNYPATTQAEVNAMASRQHNVEAVV